MLLKIAQISKTYNFTKGLLISSAAFSAVALCYYLFDITMGISVASGVLIISASDIPGNNKHHLYGMLSSTGLAIINFCLIQYTAVNSYLLFTTTGILVFLNAYIAIYGFRASLISFSGLLTIVISFARPHTGMEILLHAFYILLGGIWYILLTISFGGFRTRQYSEVLLNECMELTAKYLKSRIAAIDPANRRASLREQLNFQNDINEKHESLREILLHQRQRSGGMYSKRRQLLLFIEVIDIHEFAIANPFRYKNYDSGSKQFKAVTSEIASAMDAIADNLLALANNTFDKTEEKSSLPHIEQLIKQAKTAAKTFENSGESPQNHNEVLQLKYLLEYIQVQYKKLKAVRVILRSTNSKNVREINQRDHLKFITAQDYSPKLLLENLSLKSPIFKHCLRLVITVLSGYLIGIYFEIQNAYWIMLTIIVIMRPGYVLTKDRTKQRIIGTIIGGAVAMGIVLLTTNMIVYMIITFIALTLSITMVQQNYKVSAAFVTLTIVFIYAMIAPNALEIIEYRITDTIIGAALASLANIFLWPSWEKESIKTMIEEAIDANKNYLEEVRLFYHNKIELNTSYKVSRKQTFIAMGNLHAGFQRMTQEPKKQRKDLDRIYKIVVTLNSLLSATASLGTYTQIHKTTDASKYFDIYSFAIQNELLHCLNLLTKQNNTVYSELDLEEAKTYLHDTFERLQLVATLDAAETSEVEEQLKEVRIITQQLEWQHSLAVNLHSEIKKYLEQSSL
ncbi:hypothetical protein I215_15260 [Galbibacter marinus]|uniref:Uncharacterized protein n=1 Tax=Galbibacter marinus TaxID=555500 RepID=K2PMZ8_9FLAO|nr:FUSC family membrane protein [Galbibacter marinus]EKF53885.1 hypothetical protein I215_15260 [Galbibacter marinus]